MEPTTLDIKSLMNTDKIKNEDNELLDDSDDLMKDDIMNNFNNSDIKDSKIKVQASIQGDQVRVSGKSRDDLQEVIALLRKNEEKYDYPLQFTNYR